MDLKQSSEFKFKTRLAGSISRVACKCYGITMIKKKNTDRVAHC